jgi:hypothetical protein
MRQASLLSLEIDVAQVRSVIEIVEHFDAGGARHLEFECARVEDTEASLSREISYPDRIRIATIII